MEAGLRRAPCQTPPMLTGTCLIYESWPNVAWQEKMQTCWYQVALMAANAASNKASGMVYMPSHCEKSLGWMSIKKQSHLALRIHAASVQTWML